MCFIGLYDDNYTELLLGLFLYSYHNHTLSAQAEASERLFDMGGKLCEGRVVMA